MCLLFVIVDNIYNLREENKQLRKAHHDIHTQLQDAQVRTLCCFCLFCIRKEQSSL